MTNECFFRWQIQNAPEFAPTKAEDVCLYVWVEHQKEMVEHECAIALSGNDWPDSVPLKYLQDRISKENLEVCTLK